MTADAQHMKVPGQQAPYSFEAEQAVIGAVLVNGSLYLRASALLSPKDFYITKHEYIWDAMRAVSDRGDGLDYVTVLNQLRAVNRELEAGGIPYLLQLANNASPIYLDTYVHLVNRASLRRQLLVAAKAIEELALNETITIDDALINSTLRIDAISAGSTGGRKRFTSGRMTIGRYDTIMDRLMEQHEQGAEPLFPVPLTWNSFLEKVPGVARGHLVVVSGQTGAGKTAMMEVWAESLAAAGIKTLYLHTEMSPEDMLHRRMARWSGIPYFNLASGRLDQRTFERKLSADLKIGEWANNLDMLYMPSPEFIALTNDLRMHAQAGTQAIVLDHFQDIQPLFSKRGESDTIAFERMVIWMSGFAEVRGVLLIVGSQENQQGGTKWTNKLREMASLHVSLSRRELESDFSYWFEDREYRSFPGDASPIADMVIAKNRFGATGRIRMCYHGSRFNWLDMSQISFGVMSKKVLPMTRDKERGSEHSLREKSS